MSNSRYSQFLKGLYSRLFFIKSAFFGGLVMLSGCGMPPLILGDSILKNVDKDRSVNLKISEGTLQIGQSMIVDIKSTKDGFVYLFKMKPGSNKMKKIFPNEINDENKIIANHIFRLPHPSWRIKIDGPEGIGYMLAIVTHLPQDPKIVEKFSSNGSFEFQGAYGASIISLYEKDENK